MAQSRRLLYRIALLVLSALGAGAPSAARAQDSLLSERAPRFLYAPTPGAEPQPLVVERTSALRWKLALDLKGATLPEVLREITRQTGIRFVYSRDEIGVGQRVTLRAEQITVAAALTEILLGTGVDVLLSSDSQAALVKRKATSSRADSVGVVGGRITAAEGGRPLAGATVEIKGTQLRRVTNDSGQYVLTGVPAGERTLTVRLIGFRPAEVPVTVRADAPVRMNVALEAAALRLEELVTTATGQQRRMEVANQVTVIRADSIVQTQPIKNLTDLLETRVPGLATLPTTGAPGDPTRLRLRGASSIMYSNDPIVVVDGVRIYAEQSGERNASLAWALEDDPSLRGRVGAPSAFDRIDPNSVETIEVLNGPSAATLYGADAANGVIVVTTKRGRPGPAKWNVSLTHGRSVMPGRFPETYFGFGRSAYNDRLECSIPQERGSPVNCVVDSVVAYQALNDPAMTVLGQGHNSNVSATVSGGGSDITYSITGTYSDEVGMLKLPQYEADRFRATFGRAPEDWMERPHRLTGWSVTSAFGFKPARSVDVALTMALASGEQRRSTLEQQLAVVRGAYIDRTTGQIYLKNQTPTSPLTPSPSLVPEFYRRTINQALGLRTGANLTWRPFTRFTVDANAGISANLRREESDLPRGLRIGADSLGMQSAGQGTERLATVGVRGAYRLPLGWGFDLNAAVGFDLTSRSVADLTRRVADPSGGLSTTGSSSQFTDHLTSYGWYVEPRLAHKRFSLSTGLRIDGGSNYGARAGGFGLPKLGGTWLISDEPFFPLKNSRILSDLFLRAAYGQAGVQPGPTDRLRLYSRESHGLDGQPVGVSQLATFGNTRLRPERSTEIEGGFDAYLFDRKIAVGLTAYRKTKKDAVLRVPVAPSVAGGGVVLVNVGVTRNTGYELTLGTNFVRTSAVSWSTELQVSQNRNVVVSLANGLEEIVIGDGQRIVAGYPQSGFWMRPIEGYADQNGDGVLDRSEVLLGISPAYLGAPDPRYTAALHTSLGLLRGALTVSASLDYRDGFAQRNEAPGGALARAEVDPSAPLGHQALVVAYDRGHGTSYGLVQTVSTLRFNSLSIGYKLPVGVMRWIGAESGSFVVMGSNLGLVSNYRGKDPLVNSFATGNQVMDGGALPTPREWQVRLNLSY